ncbi:restriction endonuclease-like protein [Bacillus litorisediminis]|uniref:restriction endonuclease-like protein n=1 Tax=Bacillus litorisediminis TaxID=2922713 RepID=UPI001FABCEB7|nr:restriction endonuclease-like protein [Bacillus litorisediminis]
MIVLPHSGLAKEEIELVNIETSDFSLIIKGKPFHERYLGLQEYRKLDFHDVMYFKVIGEKIENVKVFDINNMELNEKYSELRPIFFENGTYQIIVSPKGDKDLSFYHEHPLLRNAVGRVSIGKSYVLLGNLHFQNEIGYSTFEIMEKENALLKVTIEIFPTKLDYKEDYKKLLEEVNDEIYNLAFHFLKKTYHSATTKLEGNPSPAEFFRLISVYFTSFINSIEQIERQPHHKLEKKYEMVRGDRMKHVDSYGRNFLHKNQQLFIEVQKGIRVEKKIYMPVKGMSVKKQITYDTHENRFIKWMMSSLLIKLEDLLKRLNYNKRSTEFDGYNDIKDLVLQMKNKLEFKILLPFWRNLPSLNQTFSSLVLQLAAGYRDAYKIFLTVSKGLTLQTNIFKMSVKDVATLYEYWTYLKLGQILSKKYELISQDIIKVSRDGLYVNLESNRQATRIYRHPVTKEKIILTYQKYEGDLPTISQRPDTMLSLWKKGVNYSFNYVFDAKYRIDFAAEGSYYGKKYLSPGPMEEDINTMHRYRDSIVAENGGPYERTAFGAYVLFPWNQEQLYENHNFYKSIGKVNIGGFPFLPNATSMVERFIENLIEKSPEEIQKEGILPKGSIENWKESIEEKVLVGVVSSFEVFKFSIQNLTYKIPHSHLKNGWQEAKYVALYLSKEVGSQNGVVCFGKIVNVYFEEKIVNFKVDIWRNLDETIKPVNYGIASYMLTTLKNLKNAQELPELFMKSEEERLIWQMLRRISDKIKIELDKSIIDDAKQIKKYQIRGIEVCFQHNKEIIELKSSDKITTITVNNLINNPSYVFKLLLALLN